MVTGLYFGAVHLTNKTGGVEVFAEGTDFGNPEPEVTVIQSLLQDGDLVAYTRDGNRTQSLRVVLTGTVAARQANEVLLLAELHKRNTLTVPPLEAGGSTIVYDVVDSSLNQIADDLAEVKQGEWHYSIQITSLPFGRSTAQTTATPTPTTIGTSRMQMHTVSAAGSARTDVDLAVEHSTTALGDALVYSFPDDGRGYSPPLRQYLVSSGTTTADATSISGSQTPLGTPWVVDVPNNTLYPGRHLVLARMKASAGGTAEPTGAVTTRIGSNTVGAGPTLTSTFTFDPVGFGLYVWVPMSVLSLPQVVVRSGASPVTRITMNWVVAPTVTIDDILLLNLTVGSLTQATCGIGAAAAGGSSRRLFIEPPSSAQPSGAVLVGHTAGRTDAYATSSIPAWGRHTLEPGNNKILTVAPNITGSVLTVTYDKRWHSHAGS